jgi:hypothetical protein
VHRSIAPHDKGQQVVDGRAIADIVHAFLAGEGRTQQYRRRYH